MVDFGAHHDSDDISLILRQILRRSSSSSPPLPPPPSPPLATVGVVAHAEDQDQHLPCLSPLPVRNLYSQIPVRSAVFSCSDRLSVDRINDETLNGVVLSSPETMRFFPCGGGSNLSSESLTGSVQMTGLDREYVEECDYGNEEVPEPAMEEPDTKQHSQRSQSKRSRVAEVHNLSEKRRRSRINEKMKALQNLIPNSNKTDKASMLDEAIEYLKQLQLQVQMLSIRNGLSLHAMCLPGVPEILHSTQLPQMGRDLGRSGGSLDVNMTNALNTAPNTSDTMLSMTKQCGSPGRAALPSVSTIINSETTSFGLESCIQPSFSSFELHDQAICRDQRVHQDHYNVNNTEMKAQGTAMPHLFDIQESNVKGHNPLEEQTKLKCGPPVQEMLLGNVSVANQLTSKY